MQSEVAEVEARLAEEWIRPALGPDVQVRAGGITEPAQGSGIAVTLTLIDIAPSPAPRTAVGLPPLQLRARYLVTITAVDTAAERQSLAELAFSAGPITLVELAAAPSPELWRSLGVPVRPALFVSVLLQRERRAGPVRRVREPLITQWSPSRPLVGLVVGPGDVPIAGALVEVEGMDQTTYSNNRGEFAFRSVPGSEPRPTLTVRAKGTSLRVRVEGDATLKSPFLIRVPLSES